MSDPGLTNTPKAKQEQERVHRMAEAWKAYRGDFPKPLRKTKNDTDAAPDNVLANRCAPIVNTGVDFLFGLPVKVEVSPPMDENGNPQPSSSVKAQQAYLDKAWGTQDDRMALFQKLAINGGVCGTAFLKLEMQPNAAPDAPPRLVVLDPMRVSVDTDPADCETPVCFTIQYDYQDETGQPVSRRQRIERQSGSKPKPEGPGDVTDTWAITNEIRKGGTGNAWAKYGPNIPDWEYPFPPIEWCQNLANPNELWGEPDITPSMIHQNKALNFVQSNVARIIKFHAHPKTWVKGATPAQVKTTPDEVIVLEAPDAMIGNLEMHSDLKSSLDFLKELRANMDEECQVPAVATGRVGELPKVTSGVALEMLYGPLISKTIRKRISYGKLIRLASVHMLVLANLLSVDDLDAADVELHWRNPLPADDLPAAQSAAVWATLGVSNGTLQQRAGFDPDLEEKKSDAETARKIASQPPAPPAAPGQPQPPNAPNNSQTPVHPAMVANMQAMQQMAKG